MLEDLFDDVLILDLADDFHLTGKEQLHLWIDIAGHKGTPIMATAKGKVVYVAKWGPLGLKVQIKHHASFSTEYGQLLEAAFKRGQEVDRGICHPVFRSWTDWRIDFPLCRCRLV